MLLLKKLCLHPEHKISIFLKTGTFVIAFNQMLQIGLIINDLFAPWLFEQTFESYIW
jgi:hypothetical protein